MSSQAGKFRLPESGVVRPFGMGSSRDNQETVRRELLLALAEAEVLVSRLRGLLASLPPEEQPRQVEPDHLTVREAAQALRKSTRTIQRYLSTGRIKGSQPTTGGHVLIARSEVERLLKRTR